MVRVVLYLILISIFLLGQAQNKLFLCAQYQVDGSYTGVYENWKIQKEGNFMFIFYESDTTIDDSLYVRIDKVFDRKDTNYYEFDHYYLLPGLSKNWAVNKYVFTKTGKYKISVFDRENNLLTSPYYTSIIFDDTTYNKIYFPDTWYYSNSKMAFYEKVSGDTLFGKRDIFNFRPDGNKIILYIGQDENRPLRTNHLTAKIYSADKCHQLINTITFYINDKWYWTYVSIYFDKKGKYNIELYNDDDVFINSAIVEIK
jgi:hypothetical protein